MGCAASMNKLANNKVEVENEAEKLLKASKEEEKYHLKILLLGAGESGKSTVVKQIKIIYDVNEPTYEKQKYKQALQRNCIEAMQTLLHASKTLQCPLENASLTAFADKVLAMPTDSRVTLETAPMIDQLWKDAGIQKVFSRKDEYWNMDSTPYYLNEVFRIADNSFAPNEEDMIMARIRTTGIVISEVVESPFKFQVVDVGGQRSERRKWIHCFDDVKAIIYLASLSGYNQVLFEDSRENIMIESLKLFEEVVKNPLFKNTPIFLFLNKKDLFEEVIKTVSMKKCFPDYTGPDFEMNPALSYIEGQFRGIVEKHTPGKALPIHIVAARVRRDMKMAFGEVKDTMKKHFHQGHHGHHHAPAAAAKKDQEKSQHSHDRSKTSARKANAVQAASAVAK